MEKKPPLLTIKPKFDPPSVMVEAVPAAVAGLAVFGFAGGTLVYLLIMMIGLDRYISAGSVYSVFLVLGAALAPAVYFEVKKAAYRKTVYHFHEDHLDYQDFRIFLMRRRGRVRLRDITDVIEKASPLQARRVLTTLYLVIPGFPWEAARMVPGLKILDVPENGALRERVVELIEASIWRYMQTPPPVVAAQRQAQAPSPTSPPPPSAPEDAAPPQEQTRV